MSNEAVNPGPDVNVLDRLVDKYSIGNQQVLMKIVARSSPAFLIFVFYAGIEFAERENRSCLLCLQSDFIIVFQKLWQRPQ